MASANQQPGRYALGDGSIPGGDRGGLATDNQAALEAAIDEICDGPEEIATAIRRAFASWTPPPQPEPISLAERIADKAVELIAGNHREPPWLHVREAADAALRERIKHMEHHERSLCVDLKESAEWHAGFLASIAMFKDDPPPGGGA